MTRVALVCMGQAMQRDLDHYASLAANTLVSNDMYTVRYEPRVGDLRISFGVVGRARRFKGAGTTKSVAFEPGNDDEGFKAGLIQATCAIAFLETDFSARSHTAVFTRAVLACCIHVCMRGHRRM